MKPEDRSELAEKLSILLNSVSAENQSNTPDYILAEYMLGCLESYNKAVQARDVWFGFHPFSRNPSEIGSTGTYPLDGAESEGGEMD